MVLGWLVHSVSECEQNVLLRGPGISSEVGRTGHYFPAGMHIQDRALGPGQPHLLLCFSGFFGPMRQLRQLLVLLKAGLKVTVEDLIPGNLKGRAVDEQMLHVHAPSDSQPVD